MTGPEQSVEDILASIKRMIVEEEEVPAMAPVEDDDVLELTRPIPAVAPASPSAGLVSPGPADASRQALAYLSSLKLGDPKDDTLAALVRELLRPMLQAWLDAELPGIVERAVVREIARLGGPRE